MHESAETLAAGMCCWLAGSKVSIMYAFWIFGNVFFIQQQGVHVYTRTTFGVWADRWQGQGCTCNVCEALAQGLGQCRGICIWPHQQPVATGRCKGHTALQLGVVCLAAPGEIPCPGMVKDVLPIRMALQVERTAGQQPRACAPCLQQHMLWQPSCLPNL